MKNNGPDIEVTKRKEKTFKNQLTEWQIERILMKLSRAEAADTAETLK